MAPHDAGLRRQVVSGTVLTECCARQAGNGLVSDGRGPGDNAITCLEDFRSPPFRKSSAPGSLGKCAKVRQPIPETLHQENMLKVRRKTGDDELLPLLSKLEADFRRKFNRAMTDQERHLYMLTKEMLEVPDSVERRINTKVVPIDRRKKR